MSIEVVKEQVKVFLESSEPEVLVIKGRWGVGKTFGWNKYLKEFKGTTALSSYSYVSLFGVNSLNELKQAVFENTIDTKIIGEKPNLDTFRANYQSIAKKFGRKSTGLLQGVKIPFVSDYVDRVRS
ncbi:P-loop NTPase fold protein [Vibrio breoganii]|uniref:P-loop NTPase fold protein n=1 Tax=Vibrio breoganii TaxID=553239 RepID=UPI0018E47763|nr:P-loop NTPase fold protein [Vibrio breoganii]